MRLRILLTVAAATVLVLLAFLLPLAVLVGEVAQNRAVNTATIKVQLLVSAVGNVSQSALRGTVDSLNAQDDFPLTVFLPGGRTLGAPATRTASVELAATGRVVTTDGPEGREILVPVGGLDATGNGTGPENTAVLRVLIPTEALDEGVTRARLVLLGLGAVLLVLALAVGDAVARSFLRPVRELAETADRLAGGDLTARVEPSGPPETRAVGSALNRLAARIGVLLTAEREAVADLSHRLRTPVTALRLDAESLGDPEERQRLSGDVASLSRMVDEVIREARRPEREGLEVVCDATAVVTERLRFWQVLAEDTDRVVDVDLPHVPVPVRCGADDLATTVDALLGNVFAHTPDGTPFEVRLVRRPHGGAVLVVRDAGPGLPPGDVIARGASGADSSGLGLDITRRTAEASGGSVSTRSPSSGGTEVVVELGAPTVPDPAARSARRAVRTAEEGPRRRRGRAASDT
jgi:signal transduction histidine kinase